MAQHGWAGDPPASEAEARQRIIDGCVACIDRYGVKKTTLSDVAAELGITRQTVYRHFHRMSDLMGEVGQQGAQSFADRMVAHLRGLAGPEGTFSDPGRAVVEGIVFSVRALPEEPRVGLLLQAGEGGAFGRGATSGPALVYGSRTLRRFPVDWTAAGVTGEDLDGLAELIMRLLTSLLQNPGRPRGDDELRGWLTRWIAPALDLRQQTWPTTTA